MQRIFLALLLVSFVPLAVSSQSKGAITIASSENIHFVVADPHGRRSGADPRGTVADTIYGVTFIDEIPGANYAFSGMADIEGNNGTESHEFSFNPQLSEHEGMYTLVGIGTRVSSYWFSSHVLLPRGKTYELRRFSAAGAVDKDSTVTYRFTYYRSSDKVLVFEKVVDAGSLAKDVAAMFKLDWITPQLTADKYSDWFRAYGSQFQLNDFGAAQATLLGVLANLRADSGTALSVDAYKSLHSDTEQLLAEVPSVLASVDTMISVKHRSFDLGWLADANFLKELDNGLDNAKKHLAKKDSVNAYKEVQTFQDKVNKEYEKTVDNQKKGKPRDKRFVTVEGWKFLYYNAQYIMDRLPSGKK